MRRGGRVVGRGRRWVHDSWRVLSREIGVNEDCGLGHS